MCDISYSLLNAEQLEKMLQMQRGGVENNDLLSAFHCPNIDNDVIPLIARMPKIFYLSLGYTKVDGGALAKLPILHQLGGLSVEGMKSINKAIDYMCTLPKLGQVELSGTDISFDELEYLVRNSTVNTVVFHGCDFAKDEILKWEMSDEQVDTYRIVKFRFNDRPDGLFAILLP